MKNNVARSATLKYNSPKELPRGFLTEEIKMNTDFWWLKDSQLAKYLYVEFGHHRPIGDDKQPCLEKWGTETNSVKQLEHWRERFQNINVYRSLKIMTAPIKGEELIGPFVVDIDNGGEDLEDTLTVAREAFRFLCGDLGVRVNKLKIFFTGRKGFNLEVNPQALSIRGSIDDQVKESATVLHKVTEALRLGKSWQINNQVSDAGTVIDQIYGSRYSGYRLKHPHIRFHNSLNKWFISDGTTKSRMKIELSVDELNRLAAKEVIAISEKLAS